MTRPTGKRFYDVAIIGPDVGGAAAAALVARKGLRTLVAPLAPQPTTRESDGWLLPAGAPVLPPLRQLSGASAVLDEVGLTQELQRQLLPASGALQLLTERMRLSLPAEPFRRRAELRRELSDVGAQEAEVSLGRLEAAEKVWDPFLASPPPFPARGWLEQRKLAKSLPQLPQLPDGILGEALRALAPFAASHAGESAPESLGRLASSLLRHPVRLPGGAAQIADLFRRKALDWKAELHPDEISDLRFDRKGVGFQLAGAEVRAGAVVLACTAETAARLLQGGGRVERKAAEEAALPTERKITLAHFVLEPDGLPLALEETALFLGHAGGALLLSVQPARRAAKGDSEGAKLLTVSKVSDAGFGDGASLLASIRNALEPVLPFFERHLLHEAADLAPAQSHPILRGPDEPVPFGLRPDAAAHERLLFASAATYPGFGLEGQLVAARGAAERAIALSGRKDILAT